MGYIRKALEKGDSARFACCTYGCFRFSSVLDGACVACCLVLPTCSYHVFQGGGGAPRVLGRQLPPPPPEGASGQQLVATGAALRSRLLLSGQNSPPPGGGWGRGWALNFNILGHQAPPPPRGGGALFGSFGFVQGYEISLIFPLFFHNISSLLTLCCAAV